MIERICQRRNIPAVCTQCHTWLSWRFTAAGAPCIYCPACSASHCLDDVPSTTGERHTHAAAELTTQQRRNALLRRMELQRYSW